MDSNHNEWIIACNELVHTIVDMGYPEELGYQIAKQLGSPKAMDRMKAYLVYEKPTSVEVIVDEMLAICSEIDAWKIKKQNEETNAQYNVMLNDRNGLF